MNEMPDKMSLVKNKFWISRCDEKYGNGNGNGNNLNAAT